MGWLGFVLSFLTQQSIYLITNKAARYLKSPTTFTKLSDRQLPMTNERVGFPSISVAVGGKALRTSLELTKGAKLTREAWLAQRVLASMAGVQSAPAGVQSAPAGLPPQPM